MDSNRLLSGQRPKGVLYMIWGLIALSIFSCNARADYNIICGFLILLLRSGIASGDNYKSGIKAGIYILLFALIFDLIWIYQFTGFWRHGVETSNLWQSLSSIHNSVYFIAILELLLKFPLIYLYFKQFKNVGGSNNELLNLMYGRK